MRAVFTIMILAVTAYATTLRVPGDYATIQSAFNAVQDGDTVLVALGTYAEALTAPPHHFLFKGDVIPDTGDYPRPIIDPTPLHGSSALACLTLPVGCDPTVEDVRFRNGAAMYPHTGTGGVRVECAYATFRRCVFDSTSCGLNFAHTLVLDVESCHFLHVDSGIFGSQTTAVHAQDCVFEGCRGWAHVSGWDGSQVIRCVFGGNPDYYLCDLDGRDLVIRDCLFGPSLPGEVPSMSDPALFIGGNPKGVIENNVFHGLRLGAAFIALQCACDDSDVVVIRHNRFIGNNVETYSGDADVEIQRLSQGFGRCNVQIDSNLFEDNQGNRSGCLGVFFWNTDGSALGNHFHRLTPGRINPGFPPATVLATSGQGVVLRSNRFDSSGLAAGFRNNVPGTLDAPWNWWGDSTGPSAQSNPTGRGDSVAVGVNFTPWCTDTVVCEEPTAARDHFILHPSAFILSSYPNPFNSTTTIHLEVPQPEIVRLEIFDILGRKVRELWSGVVADEKEIAFDGSSLASGVYFVRATDTIWNRPLISTKVVLLR